MNEKGATFSMLERLMSHDAISSIANSLVHFAFKLIVAVLVFYLGRFVISKLFHLVKKILLKRNIDASLTTFILSLLRITLYFILIVTVIGILGVETSSFLALFASAGVAIGMALSGTLQNFAGGVLILLLKPYKVGDYIEAQGYNGRVKEIQIFHTIINTVDNKAIIIPNGALSTGTINNYSLEDYRCVDWKIGLAYGCEYDAAKQKFIEILLSDDRVVKEFIEDDIEYRKKQGLVEESGTTLSLSLGHGVSRKPFASIGELADSAVVFTVRAWTHSSNYWALYYDMNSRFYTELPMAGFDFPFPQLDVHLQS